MSTVIDDKVVKMSFDNKNFEAGAKQSISTLDKLKKALDFKNATKGFDEINAASSKLNFNSLSNSIETVAGSFSTFETIAMGVLLRIGSKVADLAINMAKSLTIQPISEGFSEYELKMNSVQTIIAGTGQPLDVVMAKLNELNEYADRTIYSFSDMTSNIGKFTNAGVDLDTSVNALKGISNVAAVSGANTQEAARAMYNFAQALSMGYVQYIDWKSIENANMATVEFKNNLLNTAIELGVVRKTANGLYNDGKKTYSLQQMFKDGLKDQWLTAEVLLATLGKYSDETTDIGKKAYAAAQDIKTFTQLIGTVREAVGSGWAETWEIIFGNFEEAKKLWTSIGQFVDKIVSRQTKFRNDILKSWKEGFGRDNLIKAFKELGRVFNEVVTPIKKAFAAVSPFYGLLSGPDTEKIAAKLRLMTSAFKRFTESLQLTKKESDGLFHFFKGIFSILQTAGKVISAAFEGVKKGLKPLFDYLSGDKIANSLGKIGDFLSNLSNSAKRMKLFNTVTQKTADVVGRLVNVIFGLIKAFDWFATGIKFQLFEATWRTNFEKGGWIFVEVLNFIADALVNTFGAITGIDVSGAIELIDDVLTNFGAHLESGIKFLESIPGKVNSIIQELTGMSIAEWFEKIKDKIVNAIEGIQVSFDDFKNVDTSGISSLKDKVDEKFHPIISIFEGLAKFIKGVFVVVTKMAPFFLSLAGLVGDFFGKIGDALSNGFENVDFSFDTINKVVDLFTSIAVGWGTFKIANILDDVEAFVGIFDTLEKNFKFSMVLKLAASMLLLAFAMKTLSQIESDKMVIAMGAIAGLMLEIFTMFSSMQSLKFGQNFTTVGLQVLLVSAAILVLAAACKKLGEMDEVNLFKGIMAVGSLMAILTIFAEVLGRGEKKILKGGASMIFFAVALNLLIKPVERLAALSWGDLAKGLVGVAALMAAIAGFAFLIRKSRINMQTAASLLVIAAAIDLLLISVKTLGEMDIDKLLQGMISFIVLIGTLGVFILALDKNANRLPKVAVGLILLGAALTIMVDAIKTLGEMDIDNLFQGMIALIVLLGALGVLVMSLDRDSKKIVTVSIGLLIFAAALEIITDVVRRLGELPFDVIEQGILALAVVLAGLVIVINALPKDIVAKSLGMLVMAAAISVLAVSLRLLGSMDWKQLVISLAALAGALLIIYAASLTMGPVVPVILSLAGAFALFGLAILGIGAGITLLATGLAMLAVSGTAGIGVLVVAFEAIIGLIPALVKAIAKAVVDVIVTLGEAIPQIIEVLTKLFAALLDAGIKLIPKIAVFLLELFVALRVLIPELINTLLDILIGVLEGINDRIEEIVYLLVMIAGNALAGLLEAFPDFIEKVGLALIDGMYKLGDVMVEQAPLLRDAMIHLAKSMMIAFLEFFGMSQGEATEMVNTGTKLIKSFIKGIADKVKDVVTKIVEMCTKIKNKITEWYSKIKTAGSDLIAKFKSGIVDKIASVINSVVELVQDIINTITGFVGKFIEAGKNVIQGFIDGILGRKGDAEAAGSALGNAATKGANKTLKIKSPSRVFRRIGQYVDEGFILGLKDYSNKVGDAASDVGDSAIDAMQSTLDTLSTSLSEEMDANPVITPVLDLSEIQNGSGLLNSMFGEQRMGLAFASNGFNSNAAFDMNAENNDFMRATMTEVFSRFVPEIINAITTSAANQRFTFDLTPNTRRFYKEMRVENQKFERSNGYNGMI